MVRFVARPRMGIIRALFVKLALVIGEQMDQMGLVTEPIRAEYFG